MFALSRVSGAGAPTVVNCAEFSAAVDLTESLPRILFEDDLIDLAVGELKSHLVTRSVGTKCAFVTSVEVKAAARHFSEQVKPPGLVSGVL